jgi:hypothetical protein
VRISIGSNDDDDNDDDDDELLFNCFMNYRGIYGQQQQDNLPVSTIKLLRKHSPLSFIVVFR